MTEFRQAMRRVAEEAYDAGLYTDELYEQMQENPAYVTFRVIDTSTRCHLARPSPGRHAEGHHQPRRRDDPEERSSRIRAIEHQRIR